MKDPDVDIETIFSGGKDEGEDEDNQGDDMFLDSSNQVLNRSPLHQAFNCIRESGPQGMLQSELGRKMGEFIDPSH